MSGEDDPTSRVMAQADALMRRHRVFVAGASRPNPPPSADDEDDIPVLSDIVSANDIAVGQVVAGPPPELLAQREALLRQLVENWLDQTLPEEVMRVLDGISDQLIAALANQVRTELLPQLLAEMELPPSSPGDRG